MKTIILYVRNHLKNEDRLELESIYSEKLKANVVILDGKFEKEITIL